MLDFIFGSKNKKLVKKLQKEHKRLVELAGEVAQAYEKSNYNLLREKLEKLRELALIHLMTENIEFYKLVKDSRRSSQEIERLIKEFKDSFVGVKTALMEFLDGYRNAQSYDHVFIEQFNTIVEALLQRIEFEEKNLYATLSNS